jgi:hypothetical protein
MMLLINMKLNYFGGYNAGKTKRSIFCAKKTHKKRAAGRDMAVSALLRR